MERSRSRHAGLLWISVLFVLLLIGSAFWGRYPKLGFLTMADLRNDPLAIQLVINLRLPRIIMAVLLGAALGAAGMVLQTVLGNPLVEPGLLGVSQGSAFGAALAILAAKEHDWTIGISAAVFGMLGLVLSWILAKRLRYGGSILRLILAGIVVSALFSSGLGILKYLADPLSELPEITFWLMGGLTAADWPSVFRSLPPVLVSLGFVLSVRWRLNLLSLDDRSAFAMGTNPGRERALLVTAAVIAVAAVTSVAGIVSWVGLLVPHLARKLSGADTSKALTISMIIGASFVLICDTAARSLFTGEIPLGLLTALLGAVAFAVLMTLKPRSRPD